ncbi:hypothetical protein [Paenibacillus oleatilyticus]|uniref:Uncharacterized protein n=1 Tax=Paenibacillus oleatilyticus TaxID=2594886 RepID=A0ABV4UVF2_9BACL
MGTADWIKKKKLSSFITNAILFTCSVAFCYWFIFHGLPLAFEQFVANLANWK